MLKFFDGKVIPLSPQESNPIRYDLLGLKDTEPNLGVPLGNSYMLVGDIDGTRSWVPSSSLPDAYIPKSIIDAKGDIIVGISNNNPAILPAGTNGYVLTADNTQPLGIKWSPGTPITAGTIIQTSGTILLDISNLNNSYQTIYLNQDITQFSPTNLFTTASVTLRIVCDATTRSLAFPSAWKFVGVKPTNIAANKTGILSITYFGESNNDCICAWSVQV